MIKTIAKKVVLSGALIGSIVSAGSVAYAAKEQPVCFVDARSWEDVRAKLPAFMQRNEMYAVVQTKSMIGGMKIVQAGRSIMMEAHGKHSFVGHIDTVDTITQVCVLGSKIKVKYASSPSNSLEIVPNGLKTQGITFTLTTAAGYNQVVALIPPKKRKN